MKMLVTGAAGFIGSTLVDRLLNGGHEVIGVDCFTNYYDKAQKRANLAWASTHPLFTLIERTIDHTNWAALLPEVHHVYHLAGQPGVRASWGTEFPQYVDDNILATQILLEECRHHASSLQSFVFASTSSVYGACPSSPFSEEMRPQPISPYGVTKLAAEHLCHLYGLNYGLPVVAVRYFTVYGPRQRPDMAFHIFLKAMLDGHPLPIFGDGSQLRDFTYVDDAVEGTLRAALCDRQHRPCVFNIGGGSQVTLNTAISTLCAVAGVDAPRMEQGTQLGDMSSTHADITLAREHLGYYTTTDLATGIRRQYNWMRQYYASVV